MMELEHSFTVPVPPQRAWEVLLDVHRVAPCMPGATLDSVDGDDIKGRIKVKVGPISMTYAGTARFGERDTDAGVIVLEASGKETRGAGTASATVRSLLQGENGQTRVVVHTSLNVTGRPAQFGRGVMAEVGGKLIGIFADNLAAMLAADGDQAAAAGPAAPAAPSPAAEPPAPVAAEAAPASPAEHVDRRDRAEAAAADEMEAEVIGAPSDVQALPVEDLALPVRTYNSLRREGIHTVGDLAFRTEEQLLAIGNIGPASVEEIKQKLATYQLSLAGSNIEGTPLAGGTDAPGAPPAPADAAVAGQGVPASPGVPLPAAPLAAGPGSTIPAMPIPAAVSRPAPAPVEAAPADTDLNLLKIAGPAVLKRAAPVLAGLTAAAVVVLRLRRRRRRG
jgi:carbon monoxide dehydrogenase subunit G